MRRRRNVAGALAILAAFFEIAFTAPAAEPVPADHAAKMTAGLKLFHDSVRDLLVANCLKCHGGESVESSFDLTDRTGLLKGGDNGLAIVLGNAKASRLYKLIAHTVKPGMPYEKPQLPPAAIEQIAAWIDAGAPYDGSLKVGASPNAWTEKTIAPAARKFWSFQPLGHFEPPAVKDAAWCRTPLDRFILARMEAAGVKPNPPASKRQLIRRLYFDVVGLPPTPEEIAAFVNDPAPDAYDKLVDRLLARPQFGERWARRWLDLVRFAESHGFEHDYDRPTAYNFRDFVIRALNDDLPFDTFVKWQLAGDEFEPDNPQAMMATGFLAAGVHSTQITKNEVEKQRYDELDDMLATTGTSLLGLTIGCARCHDHKFDPIPQRDYYRMLSAFTTTVRSEIDLNLDSADYQKAKDQFDKEHEPLESALHKYEKEQLPSRLAAWEKARQQHREQPTWIVLEPQSIVSREGATFVRQADGSWLATGQNGKFDRYTIVAQTDLVGVTSIRLEALADPSMIRSGPGRAANGNFDLTDFHVSAAPEPTTSKAVPAPRALHLRNPRATFEQKGLPVAATIDDNPKTGWAVDPQFGHDHAAVYETDPVGFKGGTLLTFTLDFNGNDQHNIGRLRISLSTAKPPVAIREAGLPDRIAAILRRPAEKRTAEETAALLTWYGPLDPDWQRLNRAAQVHLAKAPKPKTIKSLVASEGLPPIRLHTQGDDFFKETYFLRRGDVNQKVAVAPLGVLQVLDTAPNAERHWETAPPPGCRTSYRRRALAEWITDPQYGAGALLARVEVNRLWQFHFGRGIVATPSDFGARGEPPTHPELLDWLAGELIREGWRPKAIHRLMLTSATYMQSSADNEADQRADHDNRTFWQHPVQRLEAEVIRDSLLSASGLLDPTMYGPGTLDSVSRRRSIYFTVKRSKLIPMMTVFDAPDALGGIPSRPSTTVAPQALYMMNDPQVREYAKALAKRIAPASNTTLPDAIRNGYLITIGREPTADEATDSLAFIHQQTASYQQSGQKDSREAGLADFCQALLCLNEFIYVE